MKALFNVILVSPLHYGHSIDADDTLAPRKIGGMVFYLHRETPTALNESDLSQSSIPVR